MILPGFARHWETSEALRVALRERFPRDYDRILEWFPLADLELFRRELCPTPAT
jgi:hypothetical protein